MSRVREKLKKYFKERYKAAVGASNGIAEDYAEGFITWLEKEKLKNGSADLIEVFKVDGETLKNFRHPLPVPAGASEEEMLKIARKGANVGDFAVLPNGKVFRRIRGGFREATSEDMAELIGSQIKPLLEDDSFGRKQF
jgi:hypothetical protein